MKPLGRMTDDPVQLVADLMLQNTNQWDVEKVQRIFFPLDAAAILNIPRPRTEQDDFWAWAWDRTGIFTVRSAYRELIQRCGLSEPATGSSTGDEATWKALWRLRIMPKIRVFWWRVVKNLLPCAAELRRSHMKEISNCPLCGNDNETKFHALVECEHAKLFWSAAQDLFDLKMPRLNPATWSRDVLDADIMSKREAAIAVSVMWTIWGSRNSYNHGDVKYQPLRSVELVDELIKSLEIPAQEDPSAVVQKWARPALGWMKLNTDGALNLQDGVAGAGIVARDNTGNFVTAECRRYDHISDPSTVEMLACRDAVMLAL